MSGNVLHANATVTCPHGAPATVLPTQSGVMVGGRSASTTADLYTVTGCPFTVGNKPQPCTTIRWQGPSTRIRVRGVPVLLESSTGTGHSAEQAPQGSSTVSVVQQRVVGR
ncbi:hypothetical protein ACWC3X_37990 [Streptomyces populi]|jgi:hypothetical protein